MKKIDREIIEEREVEVLRKKESGEKLGSLFGIEIGIEDNISTKGIKTRVGSKMLEGYIPPFDAEVVTRLLKSDAIIKGKVETREFGVGAEIDSHMGQVVKIGEVDVAIGVDASGEIRSLAAASSLYGLKPSYGAVSRYGVIGNAPSLEQVGIIASDLDKMKLVFESISGKDKKDSTSLILEKREAKDLKTIKIGVLKEHIDIQDKEMQAAIEENIEVFKAMGMSVEYISLPSVQYSSSVFNILQSAEFSSNMGKFDGVVFGYTVDEYKDNEDFFKKNRTEGFSDIVKKKIMFGNFVLSEGNYEEYYDKSQRIRTLIAEQVKEAFEGVDILLNPILGGDMKYTALANLVGCPAISMPSIGSQEFGIQIMSEAFSEEILFQIAKSYEEILKKNKKEGK